MMTEQAKEVAQEMIYRCHNCEILFTAMNFHAFRAATGSSIMCPLCGEIAEYVDDLTGDSKDKFARELSLGEQEILREKNNFRVALGFDGVSGVYTQIIRETEKAVLVQSYTSNDGAKTVHSENWLPKSQIKIAENERWISIPQWLYAKKEW